MDKRKASIRFIFMTILLDALGIGLLIPVLPDVIRRFNPDAHFVSQYFGYFIAVYALMNFLASPVLGSLSDAYGRRPVLLVSLLGAGLDYIMMAFAPNLGILFIGRVIAGLTGASMTVASSYMADISDDSNRSANFGMIGAGWGLGFVIGPAIGGLLGNLGPQAPFLAAAALNILNFVFGYFILPESLPASNRRPIVLKRLNPFGSLGKILKPSPIFLLVWVYTLLFMAGHSHPSIWTLYAQHKFGWTSFQVGLSLSFVGVCIGLSQGMLTRIAIPKFGEVKSLAIGLWAYIIGFAAFSVATQGWMVYPIMIGFSVSGIAMPALQSMISKNTPSNEQGELQGSLMSIGSLTAAIAPVMYTSLFSQFTTDAEGMVFPGAPYAAASLFSVLAFMMFLMTQKKSASVAAVQS